MHTNHIAVSVIIPCYNAEQWIAEAIDSCIRQTYRPLEVILIDDGSKDRSLQIIVEYARLHPALIRYETGPNRGASTARNRGFALSSGQYVMFLDADDVILPETIAGQVDVLAGQINIIASCPWWLNAWTGKEWRRIDSTPYRLSDPIASELRFGDFVPGQTLLWPRNVFSDLGGWDETQHPNDDGDLRLRARLAGFQILESRRGGFAWRRYSTSTQSHMKDEFHLESRIRLLEKVEAILENTGRINQYRRDLACAYHRLATEIMSHNEMLGDRALHHAVRLGGVRSVRGTLKHRILCYTIGLKQKERLARWLANSRLGIVLGRTRVTIPYVEFSPQIDKSPTRTISESETNITG